MTATTKDQRVTALETAIKRAGGIMRFVRVIGVSHQAIYAWRKRGWVPPGRALVIEAVFGIDRTELMHPDIARAVSAPASR